MVKQGSPRVTSEEVYKYISQQSSLSAAQARECFIAYYNIVMALINSESRPEDFSISFPHIGNIVFRKMEGKKKGDVIKVPQKGSNEQVVYVLEEDEPNYEKAVFELSKTIKKKVKEVSMNKQRKRDSFTLDFLEKK